MAQPPHQLEHQQPQDDHQDKHCLHIFTTPGVSPSSSAPGARSGRMCRYAVDRLYEQIAYELYQGGVIMHSWLWPAPGHHLVMFTPLLAAALVLVFAFMAGQLPYWQTCGQHPNNTEYTLTSDWCHARLSTTSQGPAYLLDWFRPASPSTQFPVDFLQAWGARSAPDIAAGQSWRLLTYSFPHTGMQHFACNLLLLLLLALPLERQYGCLRVAAVWVISVVVGALWSICLEDPCTEVVGASGGIYSLLAMHIADMALNRHHLKLPLYRSIMLCVLLVVLVGTAFSQNVSHMTHAGGAGTGLLLSFLLLPSQQTSRLHAWLRLLSFIGLSADITAVLLVAYTKVLVDIECGT